MANIINLTAHTTVNMDSFRLTLFSAMNHHLEWAFRDCAKGDNVIEKYGILMDTASEMYKYIIGMQALLFAIPEYDILHNKFAYNEMKDVIDSVIQELAELANEIKL